MLNLLNSLELGGGRVQITSSAGYHLSLPRGCEHYADAQVDDYRPLARNQFKWRPPLYLELTARASSPCPAGTLGFGFWNDPFSLGLGQGGAARRIPALPQTAWFFYGSPPNDLSLGGTAPGAGWLAMTMRSRRIPAALTALTLLPAWLLAKVRRMRHPLFKSARAIVQIEACEVEVPLDAKHGYAIDWQPEHVEFLVDERVVMSSALTPHSPLGFVAWIDNQYLRASPAAGLQFGVLPTENVEWLEIDSLSLHKPA